MLIFFFPPLSLSLSQSQTNRASRFSSTWHRRGRSFYGSEGVVFISCPQKLISTSHKSKNHSCKKFYSFQSHCKRIKFCKYIKITRGYTRNLLVGKNSFKEMHLKVNTRHRALFVSFYSFREIKLFRGEEELTLFSLYIAVIFACIPFGLSIISFLTYTKLPKLNYLRVSYISRKR